MRNLKVLYLTVGAKSGGGSTSLYTLMDSLRGHGVTSTVICPTDGPIIDKYAEIGVPCHVLPYDWLDRRRPWSAAKGFLQWRRTLQQIAPDVIHTNAIGAARSIGIPSWSAGIPWVCHCRFPDDHRYIRWLFRRIPKPDVFVSCSHALHSMVSD